jgi:hypothetical protein
MNDQTSQMTQIIQFTPQLALSLLNDTDDFPVDFNLALVSRVKLKFVHLKQRTNEHWSTRVTRAIKACK